MGSAQFCHFSHRNRPLIIFLLFLLFSSSTLFIFVAEGRAITRLVETTQREGEDPKELIRTEAIGSSPPRCERRCNSCTHCEAVQVPVATQIKSYRRRHFHSAFSTISYSRGDDISNYKPMSWKCKCGNLIFNP